MPIRRGELYHRFWNFDTWRKRLLADESVDVGSLVVCYRHFSPKQYRSSQYESRDLIDLAVPDQRILCCRFCLDISVEMDRIQPEPSPDPSTTTITLEDIEQTIGIRINPSEDGIPALICITCSTKVRYIKRIQRQFQDSDRRIRQMNECWKQEKLAALESTTTEPKQYPAKVVRKVQVKPQKVDEPRTVKEEFSIVSKVEVKSEPGIVTQQIVDSNGSVFTIETMDVLDEGNDADPLEHQQEHQREVRQQQQQIGQNSDSVYIPSVSKKIKV